MSERCILHVDINNCYASIEILHRPELRGKPVVVGGDVEARHGIVLAKSYEAKKYGIATAETLWQAKKKCPNLIVLPPNYPLYLRFSRMIRKIFNEYTDLVEPFGIDEAWLDITNSMHLYGSGEVIAEQIRQRVKDELGITVSIGVSYNKIYAKLGSDFRKPDAITVITKDNYRDLVWPLQAQELLYVGHSTTKKLNSYGIYTIGDIARVSPITLRSWFGKGGIHLSRFANGTDQTPVRRMGDEAVIKSVGNSQTTPRDLRNAEDAKIVFMNLAESVASRLREIDLKGRTVVISLRDNGLYSFERQMKLNAYSYLSSEICEAAMQLLYKNYRWDKPLRSIGVRVADLAAANECVQLDFLGESEKRHKQEQIERTIDDIRRRFGHYSIGRATLYIDPSLKQFDAKNEHVIHPFAYLAS